MMTPQQFIAKWGPGGPAFELNERLGAQPHFMGLCELQAPILRAEHSTRAR